MVVEGRNEHLQNLIIRPCFFLHFHKRSRKLRFALTMKAFRLKYVCQTGSGGGHWRCLSEVTVKPGSPSFSISKRTVICDRLNKFEWTPSPLSVRLTYLKTVMFKTFALISTYLICSTVHLLHPLYFLNYLQDNRDEQQQSSTDLQAFSDNCEQTGVATEIPASHHPAADGKVSHQNS